MPITKSRVIKLSFILLAVALFSGANAAQVAKCIQYNAVDHYNDVTIAYVYGEAGDDSICIGNNEWTPVTSSPYFSDVTGSLGRLISARWTMVNNLRNQLYQASVDGVGSDHVDNVAASVDGPIIFSINGTPDANGDIALTIRGFNVHLTTWLTYSWMWHGRGDVSATNVSVTGVYNIFTGVFDRVTTNDFPVSFNLSSYSPFPFYWGFKYLVDRIISDIGTRIAQNYVNDFTYSYSSLYGLDQYLPVNKLICNGIDVGMAVKVQLASLVQRINFTIEQEGTSMDDSTITIALPHAKLVFGQKTYHSIYSNYWGSGCAAGCSLM